jgi:hypothetical protein
MFEPSSSNDVQVFAGLGINAGAEKQDLSYVRYPGSFSLTQIERSKTHQTAVLISACDDEKLA